MWAVVSIVILVFTATFVGIYFLIVWPMRQERLRIAKQLETFNVAECSAFHKKDKGYVLGLVAKWYGEEGEPAGAALLRFNQLVRTRVAQRLRRTLLVGEAQLGVFFLLVILVVAVYIVIVVAVRRPPAPPSRPCATHTKRHGVAEQMVTNQMQPLVWPSLHNDLSRLVATDECMLTYCCGLVNLNTAGQERYADFLRVVNETDWCMANLDLGICR